MIPCPTCACHLRASETTCPHCGHAVGTHRTHTLAAMVLALGLSGCVGETKTTVEPEYGVSVTGTTGDTGATTGVDYGTAP